MKYLKTIAVAAALACAALTSRADIDLNFSSVKNATIQFDGSSGFSFVTGLGGADFSITGSSGVQDSLGDLGTISGAYTIGTVTTALDGSQKAAVSGSGVLSISDGVKSLTANVVWNTISSSAAPNPGTSDALNLSGSINLTSISYNNPGGQQDLKDLAQNSLGIAIVNFTFLPNGDTVTKLKGPTPVTEKSYSGSLASAVPEPTTVVAGALLLLPFGLSAFRVLRKNNSTAAVS